MGAVAQLLSGYGAVPFVGPLDSYKTSLQAGFLPFRGFSTYAGKWAKIRETTGSTELDIGFAADGSVDSATFAAHIGAGNGAVRTWYDQSGNAKHQNQTSPARQPLARTAQLNGKPSLEFDGTAHMLNNTAMASGSSSGRTIYFVVKKRSAAGGAASRAALNFWTDAKNILRVDQAGATGQFYFKQNLAGSVVSLGGTVTNWSIYTAICATGGTSVTTQLNGTSTTTFSANSTLYTSSLAYLGAAGSSVEHADVDIAALLIYNATHSTGTRDAIYAILAAQFGL